MAARLGLIFTVSCASTVSFAQFTTGLPAVPDSLMGGFKSIQNEDGRKLLGYLAGPECAGRGSGQPGFQKAAEYVAARFKEYGLKSIMPDGSFYHTNDFWRIRTNPATLEISSSRFSPTAADLSVISNGSVKTTAPGVYVRAVGDAKALSPETKEIIKGKIVFLRNETGKDVIIRRIIAGEAAAVVIIVPKVTEPLWAGRSREPRNSTAIPYFALSYDAFKKMTTAEERSAVDSNLAKDSVSATAIVESFGVNAETVIEKIKIPNVVGMLEGSDPTLKAEYVGIGSHLDHLGDVGGVVYPGADDDGSGSTALIQVAKALSTNNVKPKRSIIFMAFYGEEMGLLGSAYFANNAPIDLTKMVAELQMDMVGRNSDGAQNGDPKRMDKAEENTDTIRLVGSRRISTELDRIILDMNKHIGFKFKYDAEDVYTRSDHYNFAVKGIPIAFFFTGFHPEYHQPTDTIEKINFDKISNTARLVYLTAHAVGNRAAPLPKDVPPGTGGTR